MSEKPKWEEVQIKPFKGLADRLREFRDLVADERDRLASELEDKETEETDG